MDSFIQQIFWGPLCLSGTELSSVGYPSRQSGHGRLPAALRSNQWIAFPSVLTSNKTIAENKPRQLELSALSHTCPLPLLGYLTARLMHFQTLKTTPALF